MRSAAREPQTDCIFPTVGSIGVRARGPSWVEVYGIWPRHDDFLYIVYLLKIQNTLYFEWEETSEKRPPGKRGK